MTRRYSKREHWKAIAMWPRVVVEYYLPSSTLRQVNEMPDAHADQFIKDYVERSGGYVTGVFSI